MKQMIIIIGEQRAGDEAAGVVLSDWRRAGGAMSEVEVLFIVIASSLEVERTVSAGKLMSTAIGNAVMIVGKSAYKRTIPAVCEGRGLIAVKLKCEVGRSLEDKTGYFTNMILIKKSAMPLYMQISYTLEKYSGADSAYALSPVLPLPCLFSPTKYCFETFITRTHR